MFDLASRFWSKVDKSSAEIKSPHVTSPCWEWTAGTDGRYGRFACNGETRAHRVAWTLAHGTVPDGLCVLHRCDNPPCVRVEHLFLGTDLDNSQDKEQKGRAGHVSGAEHPARLHPERLARGDKNGSRVHPERLPRGAKQWRAKLTEQTVREIRTKYATGQHLQADLAVAYGVEQTVISKVVLRRSWKHVA